MFLKNYTSAVPVHQTIYRIEQALIRCGVTGITKEYGASGEVTAVMFHIEIDRQQTTVRLPAKKEEAQEALWQDYQAAHPKERRGRKTKAAFREQAERTAWKLAQDWVEIQLSMIQMRQADIKEVFMPYIWDGKQTYFEYVRNSGFKALTMPSNAENLREMDLDRAAARLEHLPEP